MNINYTLRGSIEVPDGTTLKLWEQWEHHVSDDEDPVDLTYQDLLDKDCFYDGAMAEFEI